MKTKFLLAALSLPMVFAACSNELDEINSNFDQNSNANGIKVELNLSNDLKTDARATWNGSALGWANNDLISMYWVGLDATQSATVDEPLNGETNAIFKTTDGTKFTSESLIYLGKNAVVYPANTAHYTDGAIEISVPENQTAATVNSVPFISNLLNVQANNKFTDNKPGYNQSIYAPMKLAANVVTLKLKMTNTKALENYGFNVESVDLVATDAFTKKSNLVVSELGNGATTLEEQGLQIYKPSATATKNDTVPTIVNSLWTAPVTAQKTSVLSSKAITKNDDGSYDVVFVVLPTDATITEANAQIIVHTTCGTITLNSNDPKVAHKVVKAAAQPASTDSVSIATAFSKFTESIVMDNETAASKFDNEKVGRTIARSIVVDASMAVLNNSEVKDSEDIIRYVNLYKDMKKDDAMNLILANEGTTASSWKNLTKAAVDAIDAVNAVEKTKNMITLSAKNNVSEVILSTVGKVYDVKSFVKTSIPVALSEGEWTMDDTFTFSDGVTFTMLRNKGTLTIAGTVNTKSTATPKPQNVVVLTIENSGTIKLAGNDKLYMNGAFVNKASGKVNVAANQELSFREDIANGQLHGTIEVAKDAMLTVANGVKVYNAGTINNYGIVAAEGTDGLYNVASCPDYNANNHAHAAGIINIMADDAITYVQENAGTIKMFNRNNEVVVYTNTGKIVYDWDYAVDGATFEKKSTDRFSYVVFGSEATTVTLYSKIVNSVETHDIKGISLEFKGSTTLTTNKQEIANLKVASTANLKVNSGNELTVNNLNNTGVITIGGKIIYKGNYSNTGRVLSVGTGAIVKAPTTTTPNN